MARFKNVRQLSPRTKEGRVNKNRFSVYASLLSLSAPSTSHQAWTLKFDPGTINHQFTVITVRLWWSISPALVAERHPSCQNGSFMAFFQFCPHFFSQWDSEGLSLNTGETKLIRLVDQLSCCPKGCWLCCCSEHAPIKSLWSSDLCSLMPDSLHLFWKNDIREL